MFLFFFLPRRQNAINMLMVGRNVRDKFLFLMFGFDQLHLMCTTERIPPFFSPRFDLLSALTSNKQCPLVSGNESSLNHPELQIR